METSCHRCMNIVLQHELSVGVYRNACERSTHSATVIMQFGLVLLQVKEMSQKA